MTDDEVGSAGDVGPDRPSGAGPSAPTDADSATRGAAEPATSPADEPAGERQSAVARRFRRYRGLFGVGVRRLLGRATGDGGSRVRLAVGGVAVAVAVLVLVTSVGVGLAADPTVHGSEVDYWIAPSEGGGSALVDTGGPSLGSVHETSAELHARPDVTFASPVLARPLRVETPAGEREYVLAIGVVGADQPRRIAGVAQRGLTPGDPHYADGGYDGPWTGDLVASPAAAAVLDVDEGAAVAVAGGPVAGGGARSAPANASFTVRAVDDEATGPTAQAPVVLVQLSELQALTGAAEHDQADQLLVATNEPGVREDLAGLYPETTVETRSGVLARETLDERLPLALAATGFLVALFVGTLFVCTTLGMEVVADRRALGAMAALGVGSAGRLIVVGTQVLATTLLGGVVGTALGLGAVVATNRIVAWRLGLSELAVLHPMLVGYGVGVAALVGVCSLPYLLVLVRRVGVEGVVEGA